jgi:hypothetical protein
MDRFVFSAPASWRAGAPGEYVLGDARLEVSGLGPLPEHVPGYLRGDLGAGAEIERLTLSAGWPALAAEAGDGAQRRLILVIEVLDGGVIAKLSAPAASFPAARAAVVAVLGAATIAWGPPAFLTLAELLAGAR